MFRIITTAFTIISVSIIPSDCARILGIVSTPSYSHQVVFQPIWRELSLRGHQVVTLTTDPIKDKTLTNLTEIDWSHSYSFWKKADMVELAGKSIYQMFDDMFPLLEEITKYQFLHPEVQALIKDKKQHFDLVMVEPIFPISIAFSERFKCPYIVISSLDALSYIQEYMGNPTNPILYPDYVTPHVGEISFFERILNVYYVMVMKYLHIARSIPLNDEYVKKYLGHGYLPLTNIFEKASMLFVNTQPFFNPIRPLVPAVIPIGGGMHLKEVKPLAYELKTHLDNATEGFIYFSLGTNIESKQLSENTRRVILDTLAELPYKILWKFELDELERKPDNVFISKWFPQQGVLRHPNIKLFITQGGLQSMEEAIHSKIPLVVMPFFGDQPMNARLMVDNGIAISLDYTTLDKTTFKNAIVEVINNSKYRKNVEKLSSLISDQQTTGLERAVWWTEYVIRHKGAQHLKGPAIHVPFYQQYMLDIIGVGLLILIIAILLLVFVIKTMLNLGKYILVNSKTKFD